MTAKQFQSVILKWYAKNKRDYLPWRPKAKAKFFDPYKVLVSEVMLQQTQVARVLQKFPEFLAAFPTIQDLANAKLSKLLKVWQGMGYNRRALYLQRTAQEIVKRFHGTIPQSVDDLLSLPGIGSYTAGAIACFAYNEPVAFLDTNIRKVLLYHFFRGREKEAIKVSDKEILGIAKKVLYKKNPREWHYALMDYGALALSGQKGILQKTKGYRKQSSFLGSTRYFRSKIVRQLLETPYTTKIALFALIGQDKLFLSQTTPCEKILQGLLNEGLVEEDKKQRLYIP